jgi:hypothetical protein
MRRPPSKEAKGRPFWCDTDGFTSRDFKVVITAGTWLASTVWMAYLLMTGQATDLHLRFYSNVSQVFMVLLGGMAVQQFGGTYFGGRDGYGGGYGNGNAYGYGNSQGNAYGHGDYPSTGLGENQEEGKA